MGLSKDVFTFPNLITVSRLLLLIPFLIFFYSGRMLEAGLLFILIPILDKVDGIVARKTNTASSLGSFLDSFSDWLTVFVAFSAILSKGLVGGGWAVSFLAVLGAIAIVKFYCSKKMGKVESTVPGKIMVGLAYITIALIIFSFPYSEYLLGLVLIAGIATIVNFVRLSL